MGKIAVDFSTAVEKVDEQRYSVEIPSWVTASLLDYLMFMDSDKMKFTVDGHLDEIEGCPKPLLLFLKEMFTVKQEKASYSVVVSFVEDGCNAEQVKTTVGETFKHKEGLYVSVTERKTGDD